MIALLQRVSSAQVEIDKRVTGRIGRGLLVFLCAVKGDEENDLDYILKKVSLLRIFEDEEGKMNRSLLEVNGEALVISQFTLAARTRKGNRPSFDEAEAPGKAKTLYELFVQRLAETGIPVRTGEFGAAMAISLVNEGPVTILIDSHEKAR